MGSKSKYASKITEFIWRYASRNRFPVYDVCCGSAAVALYWGRSVHLIDAGPWGTFWKLIHEHNLKDFSFHFDRPMEDYARIWKELPVPNREDPEYAIRFLLLQMSAFNGKPVGDELGKWSYPGINPKACSINKWRQAWFLITRLKKAIESVHRINIHDFEFPVSNIYVDPDYEDTTGYGYTVDIDRFVRDNDHCNIFVSHHKELSYVAWDFIYDIKGGMRAFSLSDKEYLFVKHRKDFGAK